MIIKKKSANTFTTAQHRPAGTNNNTLVSWQRVLHKPTALMMSSENDFRAVPTSSVLIEYLQKSVKEIKCTKLKTEREKRG